jgi:hypothetical protein
MCKLWHWSYDVIICYLCIYRCNIENRKLYRYFCACTMLEGSGKAVKFGDAFGIHSAWMSVRIRKSFAQAPARTVQAVESDAQDLNDFAASARMNTASSIRFV